MGKIADFWFKDQSWGAQVRGRSGGRLSNSERGGMHATGMHQTSSADRRRAARQIRDSGQAVQSQDLIGWFLYGSKK